MAAGLALLASEPVSLEDKRLGVFGTARLTCGNLHRSSAAIDAKASPPSVASCWSLVIRRTGGRRGRQTRRVDGGTPARDVPSSIARSCRAGAPLTRTRLRSPRTFGG